ncbi:S8 family serine peptidase [Blastococcus litoris]|uniref:S8 family serine peptidase n=1 Tax=Blastococcus litoris TaxID=2171622 RepID=UPI000E309D46|nr:S8 family serine peptidase [Blastococcus litoris]
MRCALTGRLVLAAVLAAPVVLAGGTAEADEPAVRQVVVLEEDAGDPGAVAADLAAEVGVVADAVFAEALPAWTATMTDAEAAEVESDPRVAFVVEDFRFAHDSGARPSACSGVRSGRQCLPRWAARIGADQSPARVGDGRGSVRVNVAVIDTGIAAAHPDLNVAGGVDCGSGTAVPVTGAVTDGSGHGTMVAGVLGARDDRTGVVGAAPGTPLWSVDVFDEYGEAWLSNLLCAVDWVTATRQDADRGNDIAVANMSVSGLGADDGRCGREAGDPLHAAICAATDAGVGFVAAAGNYGMDLAEVIPAAYDEVIAVTAMTDLDGRAGARTQIDCLGSDVRDYGESDDSGAYFSNYATGLGDLAHTLAAPGVCVETTTDGEVPGYGVGDGTSLAAPAVAGVLATCIEYGPCRAGRPQYNAATLVLGAAQQGVRHRAQGFTGDPLHPFPEDDVRRFGFLVAAGR